MNKKGSFDLPLHGGSVPVWLASRMEKLAGAIAEEVVSVFGTDGFLSRISDPQWFQAFSCLIGMDWHSSGSTTTLLYALQKALDKRDVGIKVCGGRGRFSRQTPMQLEEISERWGTNADELVKNSRLVARIDNNCIQDGFSLYIHAFIISKEGKWAVVQQGMNNDSGFARRYHWLSDSVRDFFSDPHAAVVGENKGEIINLADSRAIESRSSIVDFFNQPLPVQYAEIKKLFMPLRHDILPSDIDSGRLGAILSVAYDMEIKGFSDIVLMKRLGPRTMQALAHVAELIYGNKVRFSDPARFSFALGGKDGHPYPVMTNIYDNVISEMESLVNKAKMSYEVKKPVLKNLYNLMISIEKNKKPQADFYKVIEYNKKNSQRWGGRTAVSGYKNKVNNKNKTPASDSQLELF